MKITIRLLPTSAECVDPSFNEWAEAVNDSIMKRVRAPWIIGDLMNYGDLRFGERSPDCRSANLLAMCQTCHLRYDQVLHATHARTTRRAGKVARELF